MTSIHFLDAAYVVAWVVYLGYLARILLRLRVARKETAELIAQSSDAKKVQSTSAIS